MLDMRGLDLEARVLISSGQANIVSSLSGEMVLSKPYRMTEALVTFREMLAGVIFVCWIRRSSMWCTDDESLTDLNQSQVIRKASSRSSGSTSTRICSASA